MGGIKRTQSDIWFSKCVRMRSRWCCELCGKAYPERAQGLHCSHYFGRRYKATRTEPMNAAALCYRCHIHMGENPYEHEKWFRERLGQEYYDILVEKHNLLIPKSEYDEKAMSKHFRDQFEMQQKKADRGDEGRLEFVGWL